MATPYIARSNDHPIVASNRITTIWPMTTHDDLEHLDTSVLPERQQKILVAIRDWVVEDGYSPSTRAIGDAVGLRSSSPVSRHLTALEDKGFLRRGSSVTRPMDVRIFLHEPQSAARV